MKKLKGLFKRLVDPQIHKLYDAGLVDESLEITEEGEKEILEMLLIEKKAELVKRAEEIIKENKKHKKDDDCEDLEEV